MDQVERVMKLDELDRITAYSVAGEVIFGTRVVSKQCDLRMSNLQLSDLAWETRGDSSSEPGGAS
ncbi:MULTISPECIES: hypothetical protein [unclassified Nonomuraea]|uniref:hypothetical protein n=1 Tax=unclassified Nonomuraea TaxID=2593643 RepID=UPI0033D268FA